MLTDDAVKTAVSGNLAKILDERGNSAYWLMQQTGLSSGTLYPILRGVAVPSATVLANIAEALAVTVDDLLEEPEKQFSKKSSGRKRTA